jgi:hypothetical protein
MAKLIKPMLWRKVSVVAAHLFGIISLVYDLLLSSPTSIGLLQQF